MIISPETLRHHEVLSTARAILHEDWRIDTPTGSSRRRVLSQLALTNDTARLYVLEHVRPHRCALIERAIANGLGANSNIIPDRSVAALLLRWALSREQVPSALALTYPSRRRGSRVRVREANAHLHVERITCKGGQKAAVALSVLMPFGIYPGPKGSARWEGALDDEGIASLAGRLDVWMTGAEDELIERAKGVA